MRQTNISLEEWQYHHVKELAEREGKSISQIIRELIDALLELGEGEIEKDPIFEIIGMGRGEGSGVAREHDKILYRKSQ
ncbi:CopG family transcriptional regulator [Candidatus Bipolaricaulota bacterium]|nr:CopG family transcriptional regulator [Candidatus Bipolaricaulota bacterium]